MAQRFSKVAVIGIGTVGATLTGLLARHGLPVVAVEADETERERGRERVAATGADEAVLGHVRFTTRIEDAAGADLVVEAVPERLETKIEVIDRASIVCGRDAVYATTTTGHAVTELASSLSWLMTHTVGLHLFPTPAATALEVVCTPITDAAVREDVVALVRSLELQPVLVHDRPGFIGGALTMAYLNSAVAMYEQRYASREDIDTAMTLGCGLPAGPLAQLDTIGLDVAHASLQALYERTGDRDYAPAPLLSHYVAAGLLGRKAGRGFYDYTVGSPAPAAAEHPAHPSRPVCSIGVVGSGTMGAGIAEVCARAGYPTLLVARSEVRAKEALLAVERSLTRAVSRGKLSSGELEATMVRLTAASQYEALEGCDLVIEAVVEDLPVKRALFTKLGALTRPDTVLATSTSSLPIIECATATGRPENVVGMHFFNPAPVMKLVEVVRTALTSDGTVGTAYATATALGKRPVGCSDRTGFIVNALLFPYLNRAIELVQRHAIAPDDIDAVMAGGHGYPMGPLRLLDVIGLDVSLQIQRTLHETFLDPSLAPAQYLEHLVRAGYLGRKTGRGLRDHGKS
ncbi:3-hydroxybutyryl-CoA dehydrogenase [Streptomyces bingchenggensis BCW-1]|uniref:3-hydroxybutyryl-CoA dehydrogenase n=1 Tax=Streptomyces bingchenggensis (strain BCW-1) TaxID=749414 RepID=D7CC03_STRBB|nr:MULTISPECIES: 3-hydroxyacyl-CoA dehydrogenase family protein [Streptomyces]ADI04498.1 3-hydroxybutyryl-CoA dehydrogenase [Streptomyces bingchenggensis BCW-1]